VPLVEELQWCELDAGNEMEHCPWSFKYFQVNTEMSGHVANVAADDDVTTILGMLTLYSFSGGCFAVHCLYNDTLDVETQD
jgi:hypothetical protein